MSARAIVLGSGGLTGLAWEVGVLHGLSRRGWDVERFDVAVGSSAGSFVGAWVQAGAFEQLYALERERDPLEASERLHHAMHNALVPALRLARDRVLPPAPWLWTAGVTASALLRRTIREGPKGARAAAPAIHTLRGGGSFSDRQMLALGQVATAMKPRPHRGHHFWSDRLGPIQDWPDRHLVVTAVDIHDGSRVLYDGSCGVPLSEAIAGSTAVPIIVKPVQIGARTVMDGGLFTAANVDLVAEVLPEVEQVLVVAPTDRGELAGQVAALRRAGVRVTVVRPSDRESVLGRGVDMLDPYRAAASLRQGEWDAATVGQPPR
ncbi:MAG: patatin-like phospholipase family protein [Dermatophilaceae bacterium]